MTQESPKTDYLKGLFSQLPQTKLPGTFRSDLMRKIQFSSINLRWYSLAPRESKKDE